MKVCTACGIEYGDEVLFCQRDGTPLRPSGATADLVGQVIADRYHIQKKLGEGGMGQVYLAEHVKMGRRCAIKIMNQGLVNDPDAISRFNREAANASRIGHTNVCAIYDFGETPEGLIYLAMEFIEGRSLSGLLEETKVLPLARAAAIITQCADALQVAHDLGIVHRDLKPDNIMITTTGGKDVVKVVDFGIAKAVGADSGAQKVTKTGFVVGTPEYMSPEQLAGDQIDGRSDLYSLALVFYRMLTGASPFPADSQQETMIKRLTDDPVPLAIARPEFKFPEALQRVMDRALARTPTDRYPQSADFARDVRSLSGTITGMVDIEAGTQVVRTDDLKAPTVPQTRIDPARAKPKPVASAPTAADVVPRKSFPLVPAAVGIVLVAALGGALAFKDSLFGEKGQNPAAVTGDTSGTRSPVAPDTSRAVTNPPVVPSRPVSENPRPDTTSRGNATRTNPSPGTGDPVVRPPVNPPAGRNLTLASPEEMNALEDSIYNGQGRRAALRLRAEGIYGSPSNPARIRSRAAVAVLQTILTEHKAACDNQDASGQRSLEAEALAWARNAAAYDERKAQPGELVDQTGRLGCK
jgi:serine/threonine-protein kinase